MGFRTYQGNTHSENGWRICDRDECERIPVGDTATFLIVRRGDVAQALAAWALWYHENVEPIDRYQSAPTFTDDWGWSRENNVANSNHLSGTGIDVNATQYPWGQRVMSASRIRTIERGLALFGGVIYWGNSWTRADQMHYQIQGDAANLRDFVARRIVNGRLQVTPPTPVYDAEADPLWHDVIYQFRGNAA